MEEEPLKFNVDPPDYQPMSVAAIKKYLERLTDEERLDIFNQYCKHCGGKVLPCHCANDE